MYPVCVWKVPILKVELMIQSCWWVSRNYLHLGFLRLLSMQFGCNIHYNRIFNAFSVRLFTISMCFYHSPESKFFNNVLWFLSCFVTSVFIFLCSEILMISSFRRIYVGSALLGTWMRCQNQRSVSTLGLVLFFRQVFGRNYRHSHRSRELSESFSYIPLWIWYR